MDNKQSGETKRKGQAAAGVRFKNFLHRDLWIVLLDILAINLSYLLAIYLRFFVAGEMNAKGIVYPERFWMIAPFYTVVAIFTFVLFQLYGGMWQYAAINDVNRIIFANLTTVVLQVGISILILKVIPQEGRHVDRMPISYYILGAIFQFIFVFLIRFSHKFVYQEKERINKKKLDSIPALVVGSDDLGVKVVRHLGNSTVFHAVSIIGKDAGRLLDGIPVFPLEKMEDEIRGKGIKAIFIADKTLNKDERECIQQVAEGLEINDFTGYMSNLSGFLPLTNLLEVIETPITIRVDNETRTFSSAEECLAGLHGEYEVVRIYASEVVLKQKEQDTSWMKVYQDQTGQDVSYF